MGLLQTNKLIQAVLDQNAEPKHLKRINTKILEGTASEYLGTAIKYILDYYGKYGKYPDVDKIPDYTPVPFPVTDEPSWFFDTELNPHGNIQVELGMLQLAKTSSIPDMATLEDLELIKKYQSDKVVYSAVEPKPISKSFESDRYDASTTSLTPLGFKTYDKLMGGLEAGELLTFLAHPKTGKTTVLIAIAVHAYINGLKVLFSTKEVSRKALLNKVDAMLGGFNAQVFRRKSRDRDCEIFLGNIKDEMLERHEHYESLGGRLDVEKISFIETLEEKVFEAQEEGEPYDLVIVDNFYLMNTRERELGFGGKDATVFNRIKDIALGEMNGYEPTPVIPVITSSQLDSKNTGAKGTDGIKKTAAIAESTDTAITLTLDDRGDIKAFLLLNRNGEGSFSFGIRVDHNTSSVGEIDDSTMIVNKIITGYSSYTAPVLASSKTNNSKIITKSKVGDDD
jgi:hypothetical protein